MLPYAVLNAPVFAGLRTGRLGQTRVRLIGGWALERVWPIFGAQSGSSTTSTLRVCLAGGRWRARIPQRSIAGRVNCRDVTPMTRKRRAL